MSLKNRESDQEDARKAAAVLGIPFYTFDFEKEYREQVVDYMVSGYRSGITPNPDVMCNREIKFGLFLEKALAMGADYIATGHYARLRQVKSYELLSGADLNKDQSYFLWTLTQEQLARTLFPIGDYTKPEIREMSRKFGLPNAEKKDSQGLCFMGDVDVFEFLKSEIPARKGKIITTKGKEIGEHEGVEFYTIGQRHGIGSPGGGIIYYVVGKDAENNILYVGEGEQDEKLYKNELVVSDSHWISGEEPNLPLRCQARIRYRQPLQSCEIKCIENQKSETMNNVSCFMFHVSFDSPQRAVTPGQSIVFYNGEVVVGGGVIMAVG